MSVKALFDLTGTAISSSTQPTTLKAATPSFAPDMTHVAFNFYSGGPSPLANPPANPKTGDGKTIAMMDFTPPSKVVKA